MNQKILIVEDEIKIATLLQDYLKNAGYSAQTLHRGDQVLDWLKTNPADLILLDLMLPGLDGMEICKAVRVNSNIPIIMITAKVEEIDRLIGLELGADDYICKPFSPREVVARVKAILRRINNIVSDAEHRTDEIVLDESSYNLIHQGNRIELTAVEFKLMRTLFDRPGQIFSRDKLIQKIYDDHRVVSDRTVDSHIKKLRKKLEVIGMNGDTIHSVYGVGYKYE